MKLKTFIIYLSTALSLLVILESAGLFSYSSKLKKLASAISVATDGVHASEQLQVQLTKHYQEKVLTQNRQKDPSADGMELERTMLQWLKAVHNTTETAEEEQLVAQVEQAIHDYLDFYHQIADSPLRNNIEVYHQISERSARAYSLATELAQLNVEQAHDLKKQAQLEETRAHRMGLIMVSICLFVLLAIWLIIQTWLYKPVQQLHQHIRAFTHWTKNTKFSLRAPGEIAEIAEAFRVMQERLLDQRQLQLRFLSSVAHDLRNPLGAMIMSADVLLRNQRLEPEQQHLITVIKRQAAHLNQLVDDLLDATRIETGNFELKPGMHSLSKLVADAVALHRALASKHTIRFNSPDDPFSCYCDPLRILQVINNLLNNAIKYSPKGGCISVKLAYEGPFITLEVSDEGIGIASEDLERIFDPFRRTELTKNTIPGVGLGLSVTKKIIQAHQGTIEVKSELEKGSTFIVRLPYRQV